MCRPARTVVVGGVSSTEMKEAVLTELRKVGSMETQPISMTEHELNSCGATLVAFVEFDMCSSIISGERCMQ